MTGEQRSEMHMIMANGRKLGVGNSQLEILLETFSFTSGACGASFGLLFGLGFSARTFAHLIS
jgi:hypothetical protein